MSDEQPKTGWLARRREKLRLKRKRSAEHAYKASREGLPKEGGGAPRGEVTGGRPFDSGTGGGAV